MRYWPILHSALRTSISNSATLAVRIKTSYKPLEWELRSNLMFAIGKLSSTKMRQNSRSCFCERSMLSAVIRAEAPKLDRQFYKPHTGPSRVVKNRNCRRSNNTPYATEQGIFETVAGKIFRLTGKLPSISHLLKPNARACARPVAGNCNLFCFDTTGSCIVWPRVALVASHQQASHADRRHQCGFVRCQLQLSDLGRITLRVMVPSAIAPITKRMPAIPNAQSYAPRPATT